MWVFHSAGRAEEPTARSRAEDARSQLKQLGHRELDLLSRLAVLYERRELYPAEVTQRQITELDRKLDGIRAEMDALRAEAPDNP